MTGNIALDIFIGLVFVYLLYSLFAAIILEIISTNLGMRARNLKRAIYTMLNDEKENPGFWEKFRWFFTGFIGDSRSQKNGGLAKDFYKSPGIKYLSGWSWVSPGPSNISARQFTNGLVKVMAGNATDQKSQAQLVKKFLERPVANQSEEDQVSEKSNGKDPDVTLNDSRSGIEYLRFLFYDANGDMDKFKVLIEQWYEEMMLVATEWYKERMQIWLFFIGFFLAWAFNLNTLYITKILALNNEAREQMVQLASAYLESNSNIPALDSLSGEALANYHKEIRKQAEKAADILSLPKEVPDSIMIFNGSLSGKEFVISKDTITSFLKQKDGNYIIFRQPEELPYLNIGPYVEEELKEKIVRKGNLVAFDNWSFFFRYQLWGFLITALAISLGAPFWFDLLNKLMQLRGAVSQKTSAQAEVVRKSNERIIKG